ncbi:MAG: hypothetical protein H6772_01575 [Pseudomonadales bacterium]|nr:hypothetical protein [Pseudomonadales bacterium]
MDLPNLFSSKQDQKNHAMVIFIHLTDIKIQSFLLSISGDGIDVLAKSDISDYDGVSNCLIKVDESLQQLGDKSENVNSVIFGLNHSWVTKGDVVDEKKPLLKKLTDDLSLEPLGFIVISEALVQQKISGNSLFSGIIVVLGKNNITLNLVHQGKIKEVESVGRSQDSKGDFLEGLARFSSKSIKEGFYLPNRIILASLDLDEVELRKQQQLIYNSDWKAQSQFLQPPTVEVMLAKEFELMITNEAAKAVALQKGMTEAAIAASVSVEKNPDDELVDEVDQTNKLDSEEFGFDDVSIDKAVSTQSSFGVPISSEEFDNELISEAESNLKEPDFEDDSELAVDFSDKETSKNQEIIEKKDLFDPNRKKIKKEDKHYKNFRLYALVGFVSGIIALILIGFFTLFVSTKALVTVDLKTKAISKDLEIILDTSIKETDIDKLILAADKISKSKESESVMQTTGIKVVGEKAKGRVTIYNSTVAEKLLTKGTVLSVGELKFELDDDVLIASASSPKPGVTEHGKKDANVTALQIGADSNLKKDTELLVLPFDKSSFYAYSIDEDFSGGASREVKVVSAEDKLELLTDLRKELVKDINQELEKSAGDGVYILPSNNIVSEEATFNYEVGDEAEELSLVLKVELEAITYTAEDLKPIATKVLDSQIPENYKLFEGDPQILSAPTESNLDELDGDQPVTLSANISSFAIPDISADFIKNEIMGKNISEISSILSSKDEIDSVEIVLQPSISRIFVKKIPGKSGRIEVNFISE